MRGSVELCHDKTVMRVVRQIHQFIPEGATLPTWLAFLPSSKDEQEAKVRSIPVRVSVWDTGITKVSEARRLRPDAGPTVPYGLFVGESIALSVKAANFRFRIVSDPIVPSHVHGSEGHCGIEGLDRPKGTPKQTHQAFVVDLAKGCFLLCEVCGAAASIGDHTMCGAVRNDFEKTES